MRLSPLMIIFTSNNPMFYGKSHHLDRRGQPQFVEDIGLVRKNPEAGYNYENYPWAGWNLMGNPFACNAYLGGSNYQSYNYYPSRFRLVFSTNGNENDNENENFAFISDGQIIISGAQNATVQVVDMLGRVVVSRITVGANAQWGGGLFQRGTTTDQDYYGAYREGEGGPLINLPSHGQTDDQSAPIGGGALLLVGFGTAYLATKKRRKD